MYLFSLSPRRFCWGVIGPGPKNSPQIVQCPLGGPDSRETAGPKLMELSGAKSAGLTFFPQGPAHLTGELVLYGVGGAGLLAPDPGPGQPSAVG